MIALFFTITAALIAAWVFVTFIEFFLHCFVWLLVLAAGGTALAVLFMIARSL